MDGRQRRPPAARSASATTRTLRSTATRPGSSSASGRRQRHRHATVGTPPAWRRARTTSAAISTPAATPYLLAPHPVDHHPGRRRPNLQPDRPDLRHVHRRPVDPDPWTAANVAAGSTISLCYDTDTTWNGNETWIKYGVAAANGNGTLQLEHHRRGAGHVLHRRLSLLGRQADLLPPHPVDHDPGRRRPPTFNLTAPTSGTFTAGQSVPIQWTAGNVGRRQHDQPVLRHGHVV